jgi:hypothetical protein
MGILCRRNRAGSGDRRRSRTSWWRGDSPPGARWKTTGASRMARRGTSLMSAQAGTARRRSLPRPWRGMVPGTTPIASDRTSSPPAGLSHRFMTPELGGQLQTYHVSTVLRRQFWPGRHPTQGDMSRESSLENSPIDSGDNSETNATTPQADHPCLVRARCRCI